MPSSIALLIWALCSVSEDLASISRYLTLGSWSASVIPWPSKTISALLFQEVPILQPAGEVAVAVALAEGWDAGDGLGDDPVD
jgi:hypothetical protein